MLLMASPPPTPEAITTYAPLIVAAAGLGTAIIAALSRRDRRQIDNLTQVDAHTNTAIRGLTEAYDRLEIERAREERGRVEAEKIAEEQEVRIAELVRENQELKDRQERLEQ